MSQVPYAYNPYNPSTPTGKFTIVPTPRITTTQQFIGGEYKTVNEKGQVLEVRSGGSSPGGFGSRGFSGGSSGPVQQLKVYTSPFKTMELERQFRDYQARVGYTQQEIDLMVRARSDPNLAQRLQAQNNSVDFETSVLLSKISQKKLQQEYEQGVKAPLEDYKSKEEEFVKNIKAYETEFIGRGLTDQEYARAKAREAELLAQQKELDKSFSTLRLTGLVEEARAKQTAIDRQQAQARQLAGQASVQELIKSGAGVKAPSSIISDTRSPLQKEREVLNQVLLAKQQERLPGRTADILTGTPKFDPDLEKREEGVLVPVKDYPDMIAIEKKLVFGQPLTDAERKAIEPDINVSRGIIGRNLEATATALTFLVPSSLLFKGAGKVIAKIPVINRIGPSVSGTIARSSTGIKVKKLLTPTVKFTKFSEFKQTVVGKNIVGEGIIEAKRAGLIAKIKAGLTKQPLKFESIKVPVKFNVDVTKKTIGKSAKEILTIGRPAGKPLGSPFTLQDLIPKERFAELFSAKQLSIKKLKTTSGFEVQGFVQVGVPQVVTKPVTKKITYDTIIIKDMVKTNIKRVDVKTAPIGFDKTQFVFDLKGIAKSIDGAKAGIKAKGVEFSKSNIFTRIKVRLQGGPRIALKSVEFGGKRPGPFDFEKIKAVAKLKPSKIKLSELNAVVETKRLLKAGVNISDDLLVQFQSKQLALVKAKPVTDPFFLKTIVGKPVDVKTKSLIQSLSLKKGKWAFEPNISGTQVKSSSQIISSLGSRVRPVSESKGLISYLSKIYKSELSGKPIPSLFKLKRAEVKAVDLVRPVVTAKDKELFKFLSSDTAKSLFKLKRSEVKAVDLVRPVVTAKDKELFKFLSSTPRQEAQLTTLGQVIPKTVVQKAKPIVIKDTRGQIASIVSVSSNVKKYLDVYGLDVALKPVRTISREAIRLSVPVSMTSEVSRVEFGSVPKDIPSNMFLTKSFTDTKVSPVSLTKTSFGVVSPVKQETITPTRTKSFSSTIVKEATMVIPRQITPVKTKQIVTPITKQQTRLATRTLTRTATRTITRPIVRTNVPVKPNIPIVPPITIPFPGVSLGGTVFGGKKKRLEVEAFDVEVKRKGKFVKIGARLPERLALIVGKKEALGTAVRTFKLTPSGFTRKQDVKRQVDLTKFRPPKTKNDTGRTFVQKTEYSISSIGEKREIPGKAKFLKIQESRRRALRLF